MIIDVYSKTEPELDISEYQRLVARFDQLWESATSANVQQEMQQLLVQIERYEDALRGAA
jgi:ribosomal 30S subunit maturation factor RimM